MKKAHLIISTSIKQKAPKNSELLIIVPQTDFFLNQCIEDLKVIYKLKPLIDKHFGDSEDLTTTKETDPGTQNE